MQSAHRRARSSVNLDLQQVVALDAARPGRADLRQYPARQFEDCKGGVFDIDAVPIADLVAALGHCRHVAARDGFDLAQQAIKDVAPMRKHIEDQAAARCLAVIPAGPLRRVGRAVEHPPAEIEPDRQGSGQRNRSRKACAI